ncbi:MAG: prepilin-type N-terminal cleavage/methylation domain-containing protein, partial [Candidatus Omnitrophica bacterium]|nr:prepilin-type N-terminal cleavage/methylation domain-containing protein [Candidatus Omnitrophota bacterium]
MKVSNKSFTLAELMIASAVLVTVLAGLLAVFVNCIFLNELNRRLTLAYSAVEAEMEAIKNTPFA